MDSPTKLDEESNSTGDNQGYCTRKRMAACRRGGVGQNSNESQMAEESSVSRITRNSLRHRAAAIPNEIEITTELVNCSLHFADLFKQFHTFQREGKFCDVMVKTADGIVPAHQLVLIASCPFFYNQLGSISQDKDPAKSCVDLCNMPSWVVEKMITYLYTGQVQICQSRVKDFIKHCKELGLKNLCEQLCTTFPIITKNSVVKDKVSAKFQTRNSKAIDNRANDCKVKAVKQLKSANRKTLKRKRVATDIAEESETAQACNLFEDSAESGITQAIDNVEEQADRVVNEELKNRDARNSKECSVSINVEQVKEIIKERLKNLQLAKELKKQQEKEKEDISAKQDAHIEDVEIKDEIEECIDKPCDGTNNATDGEISVDFGEDASDDVYDEETDSDSGPESKKMKLAKDRKGSSRKKATTIETPETLCKKCNHFLPSLDVLKLHRKECKGNRPRKRCILCKISFDTAEEYLHHRNTDEKCLDIRKEKHQKRLKRKAQLRSRFACRACPRKFRRVSDLVDHEFTAHDLPYDKKEWPDLNCEWCSYWTMNPWRLHHHQTYDCSKGQQYICDRCGNKYKNEKTLKVHKEMMHTDTLPMLPCDQCGKELKGPKGLQHHVMTMHKGGNPHKRHMCHICSMKYTSNSDLTFHLHRVHEQPLPDRFVVYNCTECDYTINNKRTYQKHLVLHEDKRDWKCERCPKAFKTRNSLHEHMKSHTGNKMPCPYDGCTYGALKKCHLKTHIENQHTHKGMKNEQCLLCSYSTFFKGNLIKHLRSVHQLEVVTRYSVEMKAKYKNCKTGQIIGRVATDTAENKTKTAATKPNSASNRAKSRSQLKRVQIEDKATASKAIVDEASSTAQLSVVPQPLLSVDNSSMHIAVPSQVLQVPTQESLAGNHSIVYAINNDNIPMTPNIPNMAYTNRHDLTLTQQQTVPQPMELMNLGNSSREANMAGPSMYGGKMSAGVVPQQGLYPPQTLEDDVANAGKMLTYFQM